MLKKNKEIRYSHRTNYAHIPSIAWLRIINTNQDQENKGEGKNILLVKNVENKNKKKIKISLMLNLFIFSLNDIAIWYRI